MKAFRLISSLTVLLLLLPAGGCREGSAATDVPAIAVTNSYLEAAVRDLYGDHVQIMALAPPGMCPGHFDISPGQVGQLGRCRVLLLFDFQSQIESALSRLRDNGLQMHRVDVPAGLCVPDTYLIACRQVAEILAGEFPERAEQLTRRLGLIEERLVALSDEVRAAVSDAGSAAAPVLTSHHQAKFAEWLGLDAVATFVGSDTETVGHIDHALRQAAGRQVCFVIANQQEGTGLARALADRLSAQAVVFSNFPPQVAEGPMFDALLRGNVERLLEAGVR